MPMCAHVRPGQSIGLIEDGESCLHHGDGCSYIPSLCIGEQASSHFNKSWLSQRLHFSTLVMWDIELHATLQN